MSDRTEIKVWETDNGQLRFEFEIQYPDDGLPTIKAMITWNENRQDAYLVTIDTPMVKIPLNYVFVDDAVIDGYLEWRLLDQVGEHGRGAIWGNFHYDRNGSRHFDGTMILFEQPALPCPSPCSPEPCHPKPCPPEPCPLEPCVPEICDDPNAVYQTANQPCDLFPYMYMRRWPAIPIQNKVLNFIEYVKPAAVGENLYEDLKDLRQGSEPGVRDRMELTSMDFIEGKPPWQNQLIDDQNPLEGPIALFPRLYLILAGFGCLTEEEVLASASQILGLNEEELTAYLQSEDFLLQQDRTWQNSFALIIILGALPCLLDETLQILVIGHMLTWLTTQTEPVTDKNVEALFAASALLPADVFPLPPRAEASPPDGQDYPNQYGWVAPFAIGDLQIVQKTLLRYQPGEIAYIINVLQGECKQINKRSLQRTENVQKTEQFNDSILENEDRENRVNLADEIQKTIAENKVTTTYDNFDTTYGPPTTATLSGGWSITTEPLTETPSKDEISKFAHDVINRTLSRVARSVRRTRSLSQLDEMEQEEKSVFDNSQGTRGIQGIFRWLEKVYQARVISIGSRLMLEFVILDPARTYLEAEAQRSGAINAEPPPNPRELGIRTFRDITPENYAQLAARYEVEDIETPPAANKVVSAVLQADEEKSIAVPEGYEAKTAFVSGAFPPDTQDGAATGLVGRNSFRVTSDQNTGEFQMGDENTTVPLALISAPPADPPVSGSGGVVITVAVNCEPSENTLDQWRIRTYNAILAGYKTELEAFNRTTLSVGGPKPRQSSATFRLIEQRTLKQRSEKILLIKHFTLVGHSPAPVTIPTPFNVNEPRFFQFFDLLLEWNKMTYSFSTDDRPGKKANQPALETNIDDELFTGFLRADTARVMVPVTPGKELVAVYYLSSGMIWCNDEKLTPVNSRDVGLVAELKSERCKSECHAVADCWEVIVPTGMCILGKDEHLDASPNYPAIASGGGSC